MNNSINRLLQQHGCDCAKVAGNVVRLYCSGQLVAKYVLCDGTWDQLV